MPAGLLRDEHFPAAARRVLAGLELAVRDRFGGLRVLARSLLRERLDSAEIVAARHGIPPAAEFEALQPDAVLLASREARRQALFDRLFYVSNRRRAELNRRHRPETCAKTIEEISCG